MTASSVSLTPCDDLAEVALVLGGIGAGGELALHRGLGQHVGVGHQGVDRVDAAG